MKRVVALVLLLGFVGLLIGCGKDTGASTAPYPLPPVSTPSPKPLPEEYRTLAEHVSMEMNPAPNQFRDDEGIPEIMAEGHSAVMALRSIESSDRDIMYIATQAEASYSELLKHLERINALPKPPGAVELMVSSFVDGLFGNVFGGYARGLDAEDKQKAINAEIYPILAAIEKADAAHQLLPKVAEKYSASFCDSTNRIVVDFDESWGSFGPYDWFYIYNRGSGMKDCTILVQLTGATGEVRKNVHFVKDWPANSWMCARYAGGTELLGRNVGRTSVLEVQKVDVTIYSPQFATLIAYVYQGEEKDKDVAERCKDLKFTGRYQPFKSGILWDTQRGVKFTLDGVAGIPKCRVDITFRKWMQSKTYHWELDGWLKGEEKSFTTSKGDLTFDPTKIDMSISFPGTNYKHEVTLKVTR